MKTLIVNANPKRKSLCRMLAEGIHSSMDDSRLIHIGELAFNYNYDLNIDDEPDVALSKALISDATHMVFVIPLWWGSYPAALKGWFDRVLSAGFAYKYTNGSDMPQKLLIGKTADLIITMDSPAWYYRIFKKKNMENNLRYDILGFCGIRQQKIHRIYNVRKLDENKAMDTVKEIFKMYSHVK